MKYKSKYLQGGFQIGKIIVNNKSNNKKGVNRVRVRKKMRRIRKRKGIKTVGNRKSRKSRKKNKSRKNSNLCHPIKSKCKPIHDIYIINFLRIAIK